VHLVLEVVFLDKPSRGSLARILALKDEASPCKSYHRIVFKTCVSILCIVCTENNHDEDSSHQMLIQFVWTRTARLRMLLIAPPERLCSSAI